MEEFTAENVLQAVHSMYSSTQPQNIKEIDNWLKKYQKSSVAWTLVGNIFTIPNQPEYLYIFNAQTLKTKLMYDFEEIKGVNFLAFKNNILNLCLQFAECEKVMRQLAQCIGILGIHLVEIWGDSMLREISMAFSAKVPLLLEVLRSIAEELNDQSIVVDTDKSNLLRTMLEKQAPEIIKFLETCSSSHSMLVLEVFLAWMQFGLDAEVAAILPQSKLLLLCFQAIKIPEKFETACGVLCEIINLTGDYEKYSETVKVLVGFLIELKETARQSISDDSLAEGYIKLYTSLGNTHLNKILQEQSTEILEFLVDLFAAKSNDGIYLLSQFWHRFCRIFKRKEQQEKESLNNLCIYLMQKMLPICIKQFQITPEELTKGLEKETEEIRYNVSVVLSDISDILSIPSVLLLLSGHLANLIQNQQASEYDKYSQLEAVAYSIITIAENSEHETNNTELFKVFCAFCQQVWPVNQVNSTVCSIFSAFNTQLEPECLKVVINYLVNCLKSNCTPKIVASAVKNICLHNVVELVNHIPAIMAIHDLSIMTPELAHELLLEGVASVIWRTPAENRYIFTLCSSYIHHLLEVKSEQALLFACDKIALIFKNSIAKDIDVMVVYGLFKEIWPQLQMLVARFESNDNAVEDICRIVKHAMKKLQLAFGEFLEDFIRIISSQFLKYHHSSYLYMAEQLVKIFASSNLYENIMIELFNTLSNSALTILNSSQSLQDNPELTEDFFGMAIRYLNHCSNLTLATPNFEKILILGKIGIGLQHCEAAKCLYGFLDVTFDYCNSESHHYNPYAGEHLLMHYKDILFNLVSIIIGVVSGRIYDYIEELSYKILMIEKGAEWLQLALVQVPHDCLTESEKVKFVQQSQTNKNVHTWLDKLHKRSKRRAMRLR
ncbi:hypothetical protein SteCoe_22291 [Stentor coeruleus]|uniref:Exportin-1/Importin-beta-like domain-containing protein n=1 Tax=Stentor coeruleus TaxID=5963 RepID=A0A1R2BMN9_9CILI|nr:hypothetical protein SteCoe_22291 [Stentor coeruleus]